MKETDDFFELSPDRVLDSVEDSLNYKITGVRATGRSLALNSLENRVYEIDLDNSTQVVAKFYRPARWSAEQILEEHEFLQALEQVEVPVVVPLPLTDTSKSRLVNASKNTLARSEQGIYFAVFPKCRGRILGELSDLQLRVLGRYLARIHALGSSLRLEHRIHLNVQAYGRGPLRFLKDSGLLESPMGQRYESEVSRLLTLIEPLFEDVRMIAVHGDCHLGNTLWVNDNPFFLDFDDTLIAPPVQDVWMIVRGRDREALDQRDVLIEAYEEFQDFDRSTLHLIEPLRALRMIHFSAWIAKRWEDPSFKKCFPEFASLKYWQEEICALDEIYALVSDGQP